MDQRRENNDNRNNNNENGDFWRIAGIIGGAVVAGAAIVGAVLASRRNEDEDPDVQSTSNHEEANRAFNYRRRESSDSSNNENNHTYRMFDSFRYLDMDQGAIPNDPNIVHLTSLLEDIHKRYIQLKDEEFQWYYDVYMDIFGQLHEAMKEVDLYYKQYSSKVQHAGSHYDHLRIKKPDEFDVTISIKLPLNMRDNTSDIVFEATSPGYIQLRMGPQFEKLPTRDNWDINKTLYDWSSSDRKYLLRSKFINWFKGVVVRALNQKFKIVDHGRWEVRVDGTAYSIALSESGPAITLIVKNPSRQFRFSVDLVPALAFPESRWPVSKRYRPIKDQWSKETWIVVSKMNEAGQNDYDKIRSWRIALPEQERMVKHDSQHLKQAIRLIKKLRDTLNMDKIKSYYIKTLFYWEVEERADNNFWSNNTPGTIFMIMVRKLHQALVKGEILYFWNKDLNMIGNVNRSTLENYASRLNKLIKVFDSMSAYNENYKLVAKFLLTPEEFTEYNSKFLHI